MITGLYAGLLRPGMRVLDLMSSWTSHLPDVSFSEVAGLGMNREELQANKRLDRFVVQDLNQVTALPYESDSLDAVICTASIEYLIRPGSFENLHSFSMRGLPRPETDKYFGQQRLSDPVYAVWGRKR